MLTIAGTDIVISSYFPQASAMRNPLENRDYNQTSTTEHGALRTYTFQLSNPEASIQQALQQGSKPTWYMLPWFSPSYSTNCIYGATAVLNAGGANLPSFLLPAELGNYLSHPAELYIDEAIASDVYAGAR